jgi:hypothetical protein
MHISTFFVRKKPHTLYADRPSIMVQLKWCDNNDELENTKKNRWAICNQELCIYHTEAMIIEEHNGNSFHF